MKIQPVFVPKSDTATRQIQAWARGGDYENENRDPGRHSGQLSDNITEQRVLQSKILDLARERYRILSEREYQKNRFIDRQQRKTKVMKDLLKNINLEQYRHKSCNTVDVLREKSLKMRLMILARHQGNSSIGEQELEEMLSVYHNTKSIRPENSSRVMDSFGDELKVTDFAHRESTCYGSFPQHPKSALPSIHRNNTKPRISWNNGPVPVRQNMSATVTPVAHFEIVKDPRCSRLLQTLTPNYLPVTPVQNVRTLLCEIDTLRTSSKSKTDLEKNKILRLPNQLETVHIVVP